MGWNTVSAMDRIKELETALEKAERERVYAITWANRSVDSVKEEWSKAEARIKELETVLVDANSLCRSAMEIAKREGAANWDAFRTQLSESLRRQHAALHAALEPAR